MREQENVVYIKSNKVLISQEWWLKEKKMTQMPAPLTKTESKSARVKAQRESWALTRKNMSHHKTKPTKEQALTEKTSKRMEGEWCGFAAQMFLIVTGISLSYFKLIMTMLLRWCWYK